MICLLAGHRLSAPYTDTTLTAAPWPATGERYEVRRCIRCGNEVRRWAGFEFDECERMRGGR